MSAGRYIALPLISLLCLLAPCLSEAQIIKNGSFELPVVAKNHFTRGGNPTNWTWSGSSGFIFNGDVGGSWPLPQHGQQFADIGFYPDTKLSQVFAVETEGDYRLSWYETGGTASESAYVASILDAAGRTVASVTRNAYHVGTTRYVWGRVELPFRTRIGQFTLVFTGGTGGGNTDRLIDNVTIEGPSLRIVNEPSDQVVALGKAVTFSVTVTGGAPIGYQWFFDGSPISGATGSSFSVPEVKTEALGSYSVTITNPLGSIGSRAARLATIELPHPAKAAATVVNGFVVGATITDPGLGYTNTPTVRILGGGGTGATATASVTETRVTAITITNPGRGYTNAPLVLIAPLFIPQPQLSIAAMSVVASTNLVVGAMYGLEYLGGAQLLPIGAMFQAESASYTRQVSGPAPSGSYRLTVIPRPVQAEATAQVINGFVVGVSVTQAGSGYSSPPEVHFRGGGGTNAAASATVADGRISGIEVMNPGAGYTGVPTVVVELPPSSSIVLEKTASIMEFGLGDLSPYESYQLQHAPGVTEAWMDLGAPFSTATTTSTQSFEVTSEHGFYRVRHIPYVP